MTFGPELAKALVNAQADMPEVKKTETSHHGKYADLHTLIEKIRPHLAQHGLAIAQFPSTNEQGQPALTTYLIHESGQYISGEMALLLAGKSDAQSQGSAMTYARRYSYQAVVSVAADEDDDGQAAMPAQRQQRQSKPRDDSPPKDQHPLVTKYGSEAKALKVLRATAERLQLSLPTSFDNALKDTELLTELMREEPSDGS